jgi:hypothetical protein
VPESPSDRPAPHRDRAGENVAALSRLADAGVAVDGRLQVAASTWFVYGHITYDGEVVVGRYQDLIEADEALHAAPPRWPHQNRPVP